MLQTGKDDGNQNSKNKISMDLTMATRCFETDGTHGHDKEFEVV